MPYYQFSNQNIFSEYLANSYCNKIVEACQNEFGVNEANTQLALTGCAAIHYQETSYFSGVSYIAFVTSSDAIYDFYVQNIGYIINVVSAVFYADRLQIETNNGYHFEIWKRTAALNVVDYNGVKLEALADIYIHITASCIPNGPDSVTDNAPLDIWHPQTFNVGGSVLYQQQWEFNPDPISVNWNIGDPVPATIEVATKIKNFFTGSGISLYQDYEVEVISNRGTGQGLIADFFEATIDGQTTYGFDANTLATETDVAFLNFELLDAGTYNSTIDFKVTAYDPSRGYRRQLDIVSVPISLKVVGQRDIYTDPTTLDFVHTIGNALPPSQSLYLNIEGDYTLTYAKTLNVTGANFTDQSTPNVFVKKTSGPQTVSVSLRQAIENNGEGFVTAGITISHSSGTLSVPINVSVAPTDEIRVEPSSFHFEGTIGVSDAKWQEIHIVSPHTYTFDYPSWLNFYADLGGTVRTTVKPSPASNFIPGTYTGNIVLTSQEGTVTVPVSYVVKANSFTDLLPGKLNFTKDQHFVTVATTNTNVYLVAEFLLEYRNTNGQPATAAYNLDVPFFDGVAKFHPGEIVQYYLEELTDVTQYLGTDLQGKVGQVFPYYPPATLNLELRQYRYTNDVLLKTDELRDIKFLRGRTPAVFDDDTGLSLSKYPVRVTPGSYAMFNFIKNDGPHNIAIFLNGKEVDTIPHDTINESIFGLLLDFHNYKEGDLVDVKLEDGKGSYFTKHFYVFPPNKESYHIAWVTEHGVLEMLEFTGDLSYNSEFTRTENRNFTNMVNVFQILETEKVQRIIANTGWLLKNNHLLLDSLLNSKKAWLFVPGGGYKIDMVPKSTKLTNFDSDQSLYSYNVEFTINPENDAEVYPR